MHPFVSSSPLTRESASPKYPLPSLLRLADSADKKPLVKETSPSLCFAFHPSLSFSAYPPTIDFLLPFSLFWPLNAMDCFPHSQSSTSDELKEREWEEKREVSNSKKGCTVVQIEKELWRERKGRELSSLCGGR